MFPLFLHDNLKIIALASSNGRREARKILKVHENYILGEIKYKKPPYRLYVIVDQKEKIFLLVDWEHKENQEKIIKILMKNLKHGIYKMFEK